jgi:SAM-dependent methyltransferase
MLNRRTILATTPAAAAVAATALDQSAEAKTPEVKVDPNRLTPKQKALHAVRFPKLDQESQMDFLEGFKRWNAQDIASKTSADRRNAYLASLGITTGETDLDYKQCFDTLLRHPVYAAQVRLQWAAQDVMWDRAFRAFHRERDKFLAELEATDNAGPGTLELNPDLDLPEYTIHEIHRQPGGYVGDPFAGFVYHWALTQAFYQGRSEHDERHIALAQGHPLPADGEVRRILEIGCSSGMTTNAYKERFPDAEVWGIDVGGPMVRYAHWRAIKMGLAVNYAQRLAEETRFPDNHFDLVTDYLLFHEVTVDAAEKIIAEMFRVMRPGGVWKHNDIVTEGNPKARPVKTVFGKAAAWNTHRHNYEPWWIDRINSDFPGMLRRAGFAVDLDGPRDPGQAYVVAIKPA